MKEIERERERVNGKREGKQNSSHNSISSAIFQDGGCALERNNETNK